MTPKEKAKELYKEFYLVSDELHKYPMCHDTSKQCALIAVNEILSYINRMNQMTPHHLSLEGWQEVKSEINKL